MLAQNRAHSLHLLHSWVCVFFRAALPSISAKVLVQPFLATLPLDPAPIFQPEAFSSFSPPNPAMPAMGLISPKFSCQKITISLCFRSTHRTIHMPQVLKSYKVPAGIWAYTERAVPVSVSSRCDVNHQTAPPRPPKLVLEPRSCSWQGLGSVPHLWERQSSLARALLSRSTSKLL